MKSVAGDSRIIRFGAFELDVHAGELRKQGLKVRLQEQPLHILQMLVANPGELVSREELRAALWPSNSYVDFDQGLNRAINKLREALGDSVESPRFVQTLAKRGYRFIGDRQVESAKIRSLAVLPLENLSDDPRQEFFADGMTEALITCLARISALRVTSRTTAMTYKGAHKALPEIARELDVDGIVEGTVMRSGDRIRISAQLIDARNDTHLWADSYDRDGRDVLVLQADVARAIAAEIQATLTPQEQAQLTRTRRVQPEAYEAYVMGRHFWSRRTAEGLKKSSEYFQLAVERDPTYAAAYAGLADVAVVAAFWGFVPPSDAYRQAISAAQKSLHIEETGEAHAALGWALLLHDYDCSAAEKEFQRGIALYPGFTDVHMWYGHSLACAGRLDEALAEAQRALQIDPLWMIAHTTYAAILFFRREWDRCIEHCHKAMQIDAGYAGLRWILAHALQCKGSHAEAIVERKRVADGAPDATLFLAELASSYASAGMRDNAMQILEQLHELRARKYVMAHWMALIYTGLKDRTEALHWLDAAFEERSSQLAYVKSDPRFDYLRSDPRFQDLLRRMKLES
jgi:TolB-like protein/Flp pilus assembly protein TadD